MATKRTKHQTSRLILINEVLGFLGVILLIWLSEMPDLPALFFGMEETPVNWSEMILETVGVAILAVWVIFMTARHLKRIEYLEGFLSLCASCKKIRVGEDWVPLEKYLSDRSDATFSHGLCPECSEKFFDLDDEVAGPGTHHEPQPS